MQRALVVVAAVVLTHSAAWGQIKVSGAGEFNAMGTGTPASADMSNTGDLLVTNDLEVGDWLYLHRRIYMEASASGVPDGDQTIFFYNGNNRNGEFLRWDESDDAFALSDDLELQHTDPAILGTGDLELESTGFFQVYTAFEPGGGGPFYNWRGKNSVGTIDTLMILSGPTGGLRLKGTLAENDIDLAENFWMSEKVEAGELVAADPSRPGAVRPSSAPYEDTVIGVVSARPAIILGSAPFHPDRLRPVWGESVADEYERQSEALRSQALRETPYLQRLAESLTKPDSIVQPRTTGTERHAVDLEMAGDGPASQDRLSPAEPPAPAATDDKAPQKLDRLVEQRALELFFEEHFVAVALAGRVPVKADASYGSIQPGDFLTASPTPGVAMRASEPGPVIGTALEGLSSGAGEILALVDRGWYGGEAMKLARSREESSWALSQRLREKDSEIAELRQRLAVLEALVGTLARERADPAVAPTATPRTHQARLEGGRADEETPLRGNILQCRRAAADR